MKTQQQLTSLIQSWMSNPNVSLTDLNEVRLEETKQSLGLLIDGEDAVIQHLETLALERGNNTYVVEIKNLYDNTELVRLCEGLKYLGEEVWYQSY